MYESTEKYSVLRALRAIERSDVVLVVLDGEEGIIEQDKKSLDTLMIQGELSLSL